MKIIIFITAFLVVAFSTPLARRLAIRWGAVDHPNARKVHLKPMPLLGGVAVYVGVVLGLMLALGEASPARLLTFVAGGAFMVFIGLVDDFFPLGPGFKLMIAIPAAGFILALAGFRVTAFPFSPMLAEYPLLAGVIEYLLTILWFVAVTSAFSILDHMDGLCVGIAATVSAFFWLFAVMEGQVTLGILSAAMAGACLGFLRWNFKPASIFMGDAGALFVGLTMSALSIEVRFSTMTTYTSWMIPLLVLAVPLFDAFLVVVSRFRRGLAPTRSPGKDHAAHRLANIGLGERRAVVVLYIVSIAMGGLAFLVTQLSIVQSYALLALLLLAGAGGVFFLERTPFERQPIAARNLEKPVAN